MRRRGSGTFVREPKIAQELTMTSFSEEMRRRGMRPGSRTLSLDVKHAGAYLGRCLHVSPSERIVVAKRLRLADDETMAIETLHVPEPLVPGLTRKDFDNDLVLRPAHRALRDRDRRRHPDDRADRDERGGVGAARRAAALARVPVRAHDALRTSEIVEFVRSIYRGDRYRLVTELNRRERAERGAGVPAARAGA